MYPEDQACEKWEKNGLKMSLLIHPIGGHYCGYVRFPKRLMQEPEYRGLLTYVPVYGGITYAEEDQNSMVYGFDCNHGESDRNPNLRNRKWLKQEVEKMAIGIVTAAEFEPSYLAADDNEERFNVIRQFHQALKDKSIEFNPQENLGALINIIFDEL